MKNHITSLITTALDTLKANGELPADTTAPVQIENTRDVSHGDFACNIAMMLAKAAKKNPRQLADLVVQNLPESDLLESVTIAGPGFINFTLSLNAWQSVIAAVHIAGKSFGHQDLGQGRRVHIEYVSANPTGPLHVGHGRGAAYGACVSNLLTATGFDIHREYYVNDAGRQMRILALSIWLRYLELLGEPGELPPNAYQGNYVKEVASNIQQNHGKNFYHTLSSFKSALPANLDFKNDKETAIDAMVESCIQLIGPEAFELIRSAGLEHILSDIKDDLEEFGVVYDNWLRESSLVNDGLLQEGVTLLKDQGYLYEKDNATWFKATELGDEKDRVMIRANGQPTYFASDVAYHLYKYNAGFNTIIDVFGADHHGYIPRIKAFLKGLGKDPEQLRTLLVQFAILYRGKEKVSMSTRSGSFVTLRELRHEVGNDAARFFYIMRKPEQHLDFDLELAKSQSNENPVYYIQYAHARICSVWRQLEQSDTALDMENGLNQVAALTTNHEKSLMVCLAKYPELINNAALHYEPHLLAHYLQALANLFHSYYNAEKFLIDDKNLRDARLALITAVQTVLVNGLGLLGLSAPTSM